MAENLDIKMNQAATATDAEFYYGEVGQNLVRVDKNSLAMGAKSMPTYSGDLNELTLDSGLYNIYKLKSSCTNSPINANGAICIVISYDGWVVHQVFLGGSGRLWSRTCFGLTNWEVWRPGGVVV